MDEEHLGGEGAVERATGDRMDQGARGQRRRGEPESVQAVRRHRQRQGERHEPGRPVDAAEPSGRPGDAREPAVQPQCRPCLRGRQCQDDAADPRLECGCARGTRTTAAPRRSGHRLARVHAQSDRNPGAQQQPDSQRSTPRRNRVLPTPTIFLQLGSRSV